jgi:hypothetical protein
MGATISYGPSLAPVVRGMGAGNYIQAETKVS